MKKIIKNNLLGFIVGAIIFTGVGVYAASYVAKDITYNKNGQATVADALDDLYNKSTNGVQFDYLYNGEENLTDLFGHAETASSEWNYFRKCNNNAICMTIADSNNVMSTYTKDTIDFSKYKYILVEYEIYNNHDSLVNTSYFGVTDSKDTSVNNFIKSGTVIQIGQTKRSGIACIDVSDVDGKHYFKFSVHHGTQVNDCSSYTNIKSIKLIK